MALNINGWYKWREIIKGINGATLMDGINGWHLWTALMDCINGQH
jgi:hypothetical protein